MIRIRIQSVGEVEVLQLASRVNGTATVLVDLGDGFRDRYVVWTLTRRDYAICKRCGHTISKVYGQQINWVEDNGTFADSPVCRPLHRLTAPTHDPHSIRSEYHAFNGDYHSQRLNAERRFEIRAGVRAEADAR